MLPLTLYWDHKNHMMKLYSLIGLKYVGMLALFLGIVILCLKTASASPAQAATATATAIVISPTEVATVAAAELLNSASTGVLTLNIPGGASGTSYAAVEGMTLNSTGVRGNTIIFSTTDTAPMAALVQALAASGGSFGMNGILNTGKGVSLSVTNAVQNGNGKGTVYAIVAYN